MKNLLLALVLLVAAPALRAETYVIQTLDEGRYGDVVGFDGDLFVFATPQWVADQRLLLATTGFAGGLADDHGGSTEAAGPPTGAKGPPDHTVSWPSGGITHTNNWWRKKKETRQEFSDRISKDLGTLTAEFPVDGSGA